MTTAASCYAGARQAGSVPREQGGIKQWLQLYVAVCLCMHLADLYREIVAVDRSTKQGEHLRGILVRSVRQRWGVLPLSL